MDDSSVRDQRFAESVSTEVVMAVASTKNVNIKELEPPLYEVINTDALDNLFANRHRPTHSGHVSFEYAECDVTVRSDGHILATQVADGTIGSSPAEDSRCEMD